MFEWFFAPYSSLLLGVKSLLRIPGTCGAPVGDDRVVEAVQDPLVVAASLVKVWRLQRALPRWRGARWIHAHPLLRSRPSVEERVRRLIDYRPGPRRA